MRHGESIANRKGLIVSHPNNALDGYGLTTFGAEQAMKAAATTRLSSDMIIVSSDYRRARETAEIVQHVVAVSTPILYHQGLRERNFGNLELKDYEHYESVWYGDARKPELAEQGVESVHQCLERTKQVIDELESHCTDEKILLVSHGDVLQILLSYHQGIDPRFHRTITPIRNAEIRSLTAMRLHRSTAA